jgi:hypothetical protein
MIRLKGKARGIGKKAGRKFRVIIDDEKLEVERAKDSSEYRRQSKRIVIKGNFLKRERKEEERQGKVDQGIFLLD